MKFSFRRRASPSSAADISAGRLDVITLTTPGGAPTSINSAASSSDVSGIASEGFRTTVHPAASAGAILRVAIANGKFHGVTR